MTEKVSHGTLTKVGEEKRVLVREPVRNVLKENDVNYVTWLKEAEGEIPVLPSVVGITKIEGDKVHYVFGYAANKLFQMSYIDDGFCVFYDIKRWIVDSDPTKGVTHRRFIEGVGITGKPNARL